MDRRIAETGEARRSLRAFHFLSKIRPKGPALRRPVACLAALNLLLSSLVGPLAPAYAQVITDPTAPIQFRPGIASSGNGTPTVNIVTPSKGGVSHNKFREYNIDTRGLILNNSGLGGTSVIGGKVAPNPNLKPGGEARIIVNEVTGTKRSSLNGVTEVFGRKADVIVANPNGIGCVGCGFINTGTATLTTGRPIVDYDAGTVGFETRKGDITISGAGVSAPGGQMADRLNLIGRTVNLDGLAEAKEKVDISAGATRIDPATGTASRLADAAPEGGDAIVSSASGIIRAASIDVLSSDLDTGVVLSGNLQALGSYDEDGKLVPGDLKIVSAGSLSLVSGEASGAVHVEAARAFELARDLSATGKIAITAGDITLLKSAGVHAGEGLEIVAHEDIVSGATLKSGGTLRAAAGGSASFSGLIAAHDGLDFSAGDSLKTDKATLIAPTIDLGAETIDVTGTWIIPGEGAKIAGVDVTLGKDTAFDPEIGIDVEATRRLTIGTLLDTADYPALSLAFRDLAIAEGGAFASDSHAIEAGALDNAGVLLARGDAAVNAETLTNAETGVIEAVGIDIRTSGDLTNLGRILSERTLALLAEGNVFNDGTIGTDGVLTLKALSYTADAPAAQLVAAKADLVLGKDVGNSGAILSTGTLDIEAGGKLSNAGDIRSGGALNLTVADLLNMGEDARIDSNTALTVHASGGIDNRGGGILATDSLDLVAGALFANSGLLYSEKGVSVVAGGFDNKAAGRLHAGTVHIDLKGEDLSNLGQIVSGGTLDVVKAGDVLNGGIVQAGKTLRLEAVSYTADAPEAELVAARADLILDGALRNAGLIAAAEKLSLDVGDDARNTAAGEIAANVLEASIAGELTNLGSLLSEKTLKVAVIGLFSNSGTIRAGADINLTAADLVNSGSGAVIDSKAALIVRSAGGIDNLSGGLFATGDLDLAAAARLTNSGLLYSEEGVLLLANGFDNRAGGALHAGTMRIELKGGDLSNLGQIVSGGTLDVLRAGDVLNDGIVQAGGTLRLQARSYTAGGAEAELVAAKADLILGGGLRNAGLIAAAGDLGLDVGQNLRNEATGEIVAQALEAKVAGDLANLGALLSEGALKATVGGLLSNRGDIRASGALNLTAAGALDNSGLLESGNRATLTARTLDNRAGGRIHVGTIQTTAEGIVHAGRLTIRLSGGLANLGEIVSANALDIASGQNVDNDGSIEAAGDLRLAAHAYVPGSPAARLAAHNLDLILGSSLVNDGQLAVAGRLGLDIAGDLLNTETGQIEAAVIEAAVVQNLTNLGSIVSSGTLHAVVGGLLTNEGTFRAGSDMALEAHRLINRGEDALIGADGNLGIKTAGNLDNLLGRILAEGTLAIEAGGTLTNASARIESGGDMQILARTLINTAHEEGPRQIVDYRNWGDPTMDYLAARTSPPARYWGTATVVRDEFVGEIEVGTPGVIRSGADMLLSGEDLQNLEGRILAVGDLSIDMARVLNDATVHEVDHLRHIWGGERLFQDDNRFTAPNGVSDDWVAKPYQDGVFKNEYLAARASDGDETIIIVKDASPISVRYQGKSKYKDGVINGGRFKVFEYADAAALLDLELLGIDPNDIPDVIMIGNRIADLGEGPYSNHRLEERGTVEVLHGSLIKAGSALLISSDETTNRGTVEGSLVSIEGGTLHNGIGAIDGVDGSSFGRFDRAGVAPGVGTGIAGLDPTRKGVAAHGGSGLGLVGGGAGVVDFVLDDVAVPPLDLGAFNERNLVGLDPDAFGNLQRFTGSLEAARLLASAGNITGSQLSYYSDPVREARALAEAALRATGTHLVVDPSLSAEEQRTELYRNAAAFAERTGAQYGVALTEAQRAALTEPVVWHETRIIDGKPVLVPRLYLPSSDALLRGPRGPGLIAADDLLVDLSGRLTNTGTLAAEGLASISASSIINQRMADLDMRERAYAGGRGDTGFITAGTLLMTTDGDLVNRGGTIASAGSLDLRVGGSLLNETQRYRRAVDGFDLCLGAACGGDAVDWNIAKITAGRDLTVIAGEDLINRGGELGSVTDMLLAARGNVEFETLKDSFLSKDFHQRGFLSGFDIVEHTITTAEAKAQSLVGDVSILAGYGVCDGGALCAGDNKSDAVLNGALVSAYGDVALKATGGIEMGAVSQEVHNTYKEWGFKGLGWGKVKQRWNDISTSVTRISGDNVTLDASFGDGSGGPITGTGTKIQAAGDLLMLTDTDIRFKAAQDARYFTEKGFYIGLTFPGSAGIDAAYRGTPGEKVDPLEGLASVSPLTATLMRLSQSENGIAAGLAALYVGVGGLNGIKAGPEAMVKNALGDLSPQSLLGSIGITISSWKNEQRWSESQMAELVAGGDVVMKAGLDVVLDEGTQLIAGEDVAIDAGRDIILAALEDYAATRAKSFGLSIQPFALKVEGSYAKATGDSASHTNARIVAGGTADLDAGRDIALLGGVVAGERVEASAGRDLVIHSVRDASTYREKSLGASLSLSPSGLLGGSFSYGRTTGDYANVSEQSGIVAGEGGFAVEAGGRVDLKAGLIVSSADAGLNSLRAAELTFSDLENRSEAKTASYGLSLSPGGLPVPQVGMPAEESERGTARSTVSPGALTLTDQRQDTAALNRDPDNTNVAVGRYDISALKQKQQDAALLSQALNMAVGDIAQVAGFAEGSPEKVALHAVAGAVGAAVAGGDVALGALAGGAGELANAILVDVLAEHPSLSEEQKQAVQQWGAALVGAALGGDLGAATALDAYKYNYLTHEQIAAFDEAMKACGGDGACKQAVTEAYQDLSADNDEALRACASWDCRAAHMAEIERAQELANEVLHSPYAEAEPRYVIMLQKLQSRSWVSQSAEIAAQQAMAMDLARDECGSDSACVERVANDAFSAWAERVSIDGRDVKVNIGVRGRMVTVQSSAPTLFRWTKPKAARAIAQVQPQLTVMCSAGQRPMPAGKSIMVHARFFHGTFICVKPGESAVNVMLNETDKLLEGV
ncbi:hemagglutinin repeat-containing protein [Chelativorans xinjiangense]|uniref:two-partner secretion domain-containing protein n=1 Tax=Chelativorans xinjiangense TaxID=2681485 RepID=UPI00135C21EC|nr:hemagglutinin repeat-containing protein [Chelativorans xinjiangense]